MSPFIFAMRSGGRRAPQAVRHRSLCRYADLL